jgi:drug/metabolite transporter (DMT)-like permease
LLSGHHTGEPATVQEIRHPSDRDTRSALDARAVLVKSWVLVGIAIFGVSLSAPVTAAAVVPALTIGFWRTGLGSLVTFPWAWGWFRAERTARGTRALLYRLRGSGMSGIFLAVHFCLWLPSLRFTSVAAATALVSTPPIWTVIVDRVRGRPVGARLLTGIAIAMCGIVAITGVDLGNSGRAVFGDLLALGGGLAAAGYMLMGESERRHLPAAVYTATTYGVAAVLILPVCLVSGSELAGFPARGWLEIAVITVFAQLLGHTLLNVAVPVVGATPMALALLIEVPGAALIAWVWYGEQPPLVVLPGALLVLLGLGIVIAARARDAAGTDLPEPVG